MKPAIKYHDFLIWFGIAVATWSNMAGSEPTATSRIVWAIPAVSFAVIVHAHPADGLTRWLKWLIALGQGAISYTHMYELAEQHGFDELAYLFPLCADAVVLFGLRLKEIGDREQQVTAARDERQLAAELQATKTELQATQKRVEVQSTKTVRRAVDTPKRGPVKQLSAVPGNGNPTEIQAAVWAILANETTPQGDLTEWDRKTAQRLQNEIGKGSQRSVQRARTAWTGTPTRKVEAAS